MTVCDMLSWYEAVHDCFSRTFLKLRKLTVGVSLDLCSPPLRCDACAALRRVKFGCVAMSPLS